MDIGGDMSLASMPNLRPRFSSFFCLTSFITLIPFLVSGFLWFYSLSSFPPLSFSHLSSCLSSPLISFPLPSLLWPLPSPSLRSHLLCSYFLSSLLVFHLHLFPLLSLHFLCFICLLLFSFHLFLFLSFVCGVCVYLWCTGKLTGTAFTIITHTLLQYPAPCISVALMQGIRLALIDSAQPCVGWFYIIVNMGWMPAPVCEKNPRASVLQPAPKSLLKSKHRHTERTLMRT